MCYPTCLINIRSWNNETNATNNSIFVSNLQFYFAKCYISLSLEFGATLYVLYFSLPSFREFLTNRFPFVSLIYSNK